MILENLDLYEMVTVIEEIERGIPYHYNSQDLKTLLDALEDCQRKVIKQIKLIESYI